MWTDKLKSSLEKLNFYFFSSSFFTIDFKICLYARHLDDIFWLNFANSSKLWENKMCQWTSFKFSAIKSFSQSFGELTRCCQNTSCGQCEASKCLVHRHILKSIVKKLEEKNQKFSFFGTWINFNQVCNSHAICRAAHPWAYKKRATVQLIRTMKNLSVTPKFCAEFQGVGLYKNGQVRVEPIFNDPDLLDAIVPKQFWISWSLDTIQVWADFWFPVRLLSFGTFVYL